jgi:regulator of protease activity HflC (stomatin/prohibitin superfamily)
MAGFPVLVGIGMGVALLLIALLLRRAILHVPDSWVAVTRDPRLHTVRRLIPGPRTALRWPFLEDLWGWLDTAPRVLSGRTTGVRSADGIPIEVEWNVSFRLNPLAIPPGNRPAALRALLRNPDDLIRLHLEDVLRTRMGEEPLERLCAGDRREFLAGRIRAGLVRRLADQGVEVQRVMLGAIHPPVESQQARILQEALRQLTPEDAQRMAELARVHILGAEEGFLILPLPASSAGPDARSRAA